MKTILIAILLFGIASTAMAESPTLRQGPIGIYDLYHDMIEQQCATIDVRIAGFKCSSIEHRYIPVLLFAQEPGALSEARHKEIIFEVEKFAAQLATYRITIFQYRMPGWPQSDIGMCTFGTEANAPRRIVPRMFCYPAI